MIANLRKKKRSKENQNIFFFVLIAFSLLLTISFLLVNNIKISQRRAKLAVQIKALEDKIQQAEKKKEKFKNVISQAKSKENIEKMARDQLGLKKPGEEVVVVKKKEKEADKENKEKNKSWWELIKSIFNR